MFGFTFQDVVREFSEKNRVHLARILAEMVDKRDSREEKRDSREEKRDSREEKRDGRRVPYEKYPGTITPEQLPYYLIGAKTLLILTPE